MMLQNIVTLTLNDLAIAFRNKTIFLILFIPLFVFFSIKMVDISETGVKKSRLGVILTEVYAPTILKTINSAGQLFTVVPVFTEVEGKRLLKEKKIDGLLLRTGQEQQSVILVVFKKESLQALSIVESFAALQKAVEGKNRSWISEVTPLQEGGVQKQTLPTWILMLILLVGFIVMPAQVAEEKEKKLLLALLQTPIREIEWLAGKVISGMMLILTAVLLLHLLAKLEPGNVLSYVAFLIAGSFCFSSYGILLGFLCRNQASARTLGVMFYLPHLLPSALSDFSQKLTAVAPFLPSYQLYEPIKSILLDGGSLSNLSQEWLYLLIFGMASLCGSYLLMKRRWLM